MGRAFDVPRIVATVSDELGDRRGNARIREQLQPDHKGDDDTVNAVACRAKRPREYRRHRIRARKETDSGDQDLAIASQLALSLVIRHYVVSRQHDGGSAATRLSSRRVIEQESRTRVAITY